VPGGIDGEDKASHLLLVMVPATASSARGRVGADVLCHVEQPVLRQDGDMLQKERLIAAVVTSISRKRSHATGKAGVAKTMAIKGVMGANVEQGGLGHAAKTIWMSARDQVHVLIIATIHPAATRVTVITAIPKLVQVAT